MLAPCFLLAQAEQSTTLPDGTPWWGAIAFTMLMPLIAAGVNWFMRSGIKQTDLTKLQADLQELKLELAAKVAIIVQLRAEVQDLEISVAKLKRDVNSCEERHEATIRENSVLQGLLIKQSMKIDELSARIPG